MKLAIAIAVALLATVSMGMALSAKAPAWLEDMGPGETYTYGDYSTQLATVDEDTFVPQTLNSKLTFTADGVSADVDQTVSTSIMGTPEGINRQLLEQSAAAYVYQNDEGLTVDSENDDTATTLVMNICKEQNALFSGKIVSNTASELVYGVDAPFDGTGANDKPNTYGQIGLDDAYGGGHGLAWLDLTGEPAAFVTTYNDDATLTANAGTENEVSLRQSVVDAKVTVSANAVGEGGVPNLVQIVDPYCVGVGETWVLNPDGSEQNLGKIGDLQPGEWEGSAQLTEAASSIHSDVTLTDKEVMILGDIMNFRTMDGSAGLDGAFANAITSADSKMNIDLDGDMDFWWE